MMSAFGVDSCAAANATMPNGDIFYDWVTAHAGQAPRFWGQYIAYPECDDITTDIASYLHKKGCYILVIYGAATSKTVSTKAQGESAANAAITAAENLGIPAGVCLFNDIEPGWPVTADYIDGYWSTIHASDKYVPGFYADTRAGEYFNNAYCTVRSQKPGQDCHVWSQYPKVSCGTAAERPAWNPDHPDCLTQDQIGLWQYANVCYVYDDETDWAVDLDELRDTTLLDILWAPS